MVSRWKLSTRPLMGHFIRQQARIEGELGVSIAFDHIPGEEKSIFDKLSPPASLESERDADYANCEKKEVNQRGSHAVRQLCHLLVF